MTCLSFSFIWIPVFLIVLQVQYSLAQKTEAMPAPLAMIQGEINDMKVIAQGDAVTFFTGKKPTLAINQNCIEDLHCTMHKNRTEAVLLNPGGVLIVQQKPEKNQEVVDAAPTALPSLTQTLPPLRTVSSETFFISSEHIEPTPTIATLYTGIPVIDQTPGVSWINSETMRLLAETVEMANLFAASSRSDDELTLITPSPTNSVKVLTTITAEQDELLRQLTSTRPIPAPTPVKTGYDPSFMEDKEILIETRLDILKIKPSPSQQWHKDQWHKDNTETASFIFTVKQVGTSTGGGTESTSSENHDSTQDQKGSTPSSDSPEATNLPKSLEVFSELSVVTEKKAETMQAETMQAETIQVETGLPDDVWEHIFQYLNPDRDLKTLRTVNTAFKEAVDSFFVKLAAQNYLQAVPLNGRSSRKKHICDVFKPICSQQHLSEWLKQHWPGRYEVQLLGSLKRNAEYLPAYLAYTVRKALDDTPRFTLVDRCEIKAKNLFVVGQNFDLYISPDSNTLVVISRDPKAAEQHPTLYKQEASGNWFKHTELNHSNPLMAAFSPDGLHLVTVSLDFTVKVWRKEGDSWNHEVFSYKHSGEITSALFSQDGTCLATSSKDGTVQISKPDKCKHWHSAQTLKHKVMFFSFKTTPEPYRVSSVHFSPDNRFLITISWGLNLALSPSDQNENIAHFWQLNEQGKWQIVYEVRHKEWINVVAFSPDKKNVLLASLGDSSSEGIWAFDEATGWSQKEDLEKKCHLTSGWGIQDQFRNYGVQSGHFSQDHRRLVICTYKKTFIIFRLGKAEIEEEQRLEHKDQVCNPRFSPEGSHIVSCSENTVQIWGQVGDGICRKWVQKANFRCNSKVRAAALSPNQRFLLVLEKDYQHILEIIPDWRKEQEKEQEKEEQEKDTL